MGEVDFSMFAYESLVSEFGAVAQMCVSLVDLGSLNGRVEQGVTACLLGGSVRGVVPSVIIYINKVATVFKAQYYIVQTALQSTA